MIRYFINNTDRKIYNILILNEDKIISNNIENESKKYPELNIIKKEDFNVTDDLLSTINIAVINMMWKNENCGIDIANYIWKLYFRIKIILLVDQQELECCLFYPQIALSRSIHDYLNKDSDVKKIVDRIRFHLKGDNCYAN